MLEKSPLIIKNADLEAQIRFMFAVPEIATSGEVPVPLYWQMGLYEKTISASSETKTQERKNRLLQRRIILGEQALKSYENALHQEELRFLNEMDGRKLLYRKKEEEIEFIHQTALQEHQATLLEREEELKQKEHENAVQTAELENQERLLALKTRHETAEQEIIEKLSMTATKVVTAEAQAEEISTALDNVKAEFLNLHRVEARDYQTNEKRVFEAYDERNILEIKDVYLYSISRERYVLYLPTMSVRRGKVSVMTSGDSEVLELAYKVLFRTYGTNFSIRSGEVRINAMPTTGVLKQDFKKVFGKVTASYRDYFDDAFHSKKSVIKTYNLGKEESSFKMALLTLGGSADILKKPCAKLTENEKSLVAYAAAFTADIPLVAFLKPFRKDDPAFNEGFLSLLQNRPKGKAYLVLTSETELILKLDEFALYRLD